MVSPEFLPRDGKGILFLDELNMAPPAMQGVAQQLILDRRVGSYVVPDGWFVWAAGNRKEDRAAVFDMPSPLANRFLHLQVEADFDSFKAYALARGVHEQIIAFLSFRSTLLHKIDPQQPAWPSPRSWVMASLLHTARLDITPAIGTGATAEFTAFVELYRTLPNLTPILEGKGDSIPFPKEPSAKYATAIGLTVRATDANQAYNAFTWLSRVATAEWVQLFAVDLFRLMRSRGQMGVLAKLVQFMLDYQNIDPKVRIQIASSDDTPADVLEKLSNDRHHEVLRAVASNPNTPVAILQKLGIKFPEAITANPIFNLLLLENSDSKLVKFVRLCLARSSTTSVEILEKLLETEDRAILIAVAENQTVPQVILEKLATNRDNFIRHLVAENTNTSLNILDNLADDEEESVRRTVAENANISLQILEKLAKDRSQHVRGVVGQNTNTPVDVLTKLATDRAQYVRRRVAENINTPQAILAKLMCESAPRVRSRVARNANILPHFLDNLAKDSERSVRQAVAENQHTSLQILGQLAEDVDKNVRQAVARNQKISTHIIERLARDSDRDVRQAIAEHPLTSVEILQRLTIDRSKYVRLAVAKNKNTSLELLEKLIKDENNLVREAATENLAAKLNN